MKYVALLRGINVGGNNMISMADLKSAFEKGGFTSVRTHINSGNVLFESNETDKEELVRTLEATLSKRFSYTSRLVIRSQKEMKDTVANVPDEWEKKNDLRMYVAFVKEPVTPAAVIKEVAVKEGIDWVKSGPGVVYMSTKLSGLTKSGFTKLIGKKIYKDMTMRNFNTVQKLLALLEM